MPLNNGVGVVLMDKWDAQQARGHVWPTTTNPHRSMKFATEQFIDVVLDEIDQDYAIDERHIFILAWSSSGSSAWHDQMPYMNYSSISHFLNSKAAFTTGVSTWHQKY